MTRFFTSTAVLVLTSVAVFGQTDTAKIITGGLPDNIIQDKGKYNKTGQKTGMWIEYFDGDTNKGKIKSKTKYKNGLKQGRCIKYYDTGDKIIVQWEGRYKKDKLHGVAKAYDSLGRVTHWTRKAQ